MAASQDVAQLATDLTEMKQELVVLQSMSRSLLKGHQSAQNSPKRGCLRWSWADPEDEGAGPGSYNVSTELGKASPLSHQGTSPRAVVPQSRQIKPLTLLGSQSPPLNRYSPKSSLVKHTDPIVSISQADFKRLPYLKEMKERSPGPVYLLTSTLPKGGRISGSKRDTFKQFVLNSNPSPQHYCAEKPSRQQNVRFNKGSREHNMKDYIPGIERFLKGQQGVFDGTITQPVSSRASSLMKRTGHQELLLLHALKTPSVGTYSIGGPQQQRGNFTFTKAKRTFDVKLMGISHDILRDCVV